MSGPVIDLARDVCAAPAVSGGKEWLVTNGIGGYAMGTVAGFRTRRYHGLLVAALDPPVGRTLLVAKIDEEAIYQDRTYALGANRWAGGVMDPTGFAYLNRFYLDGTTPVWTYALGSALLEKRIWMAPGANVTFVRYDLTRASAPLKLQLRTFVAYRDHHAMTRGGDWTMQIERAGGGVRVAAFSGAQPIWLRTDRGKVRPEHTWYHNVRLEEEAYRGFGGTEDMLHAATVEVKLAPGKSVVLTCSASADAPAAPAAWAARQDHERARIDAAGAASASHRQLVLAADQFVVARPTKEEPAGQTVIAGYPWFTDWGRDTFVALPGLLLATGREDAAVHVLRTFASFVDRGMIPNRFPDAGDHPEYNTADATLWFVEAVRATVQATGDEALLAGLFPVLHGIVRSHLQGTRYEIYVDERDGLLRAGEGGVQLTWMDAKVGDWVVTPRIGKPVEINALWINALRSIADFAERLGFDSSVYSEHADQATESFDRFWNAARGCCFDVIDGPEGHDAALRPNQLLAVSLPHSPLSPDRQRAVVDACERHLLTPHGLRSLAPGDSSYEGHYGGDQTERDGAYHQGTVWGWLIGPFVEAHLRVHGDEALARSFLVPLLRHLSAHGLGSASEIFDGDAPFTPRGCPAQAWTVAELLRMGTRTGLFSDP